MMISSLAAARRGSRRYPNPRSQLFGNKLNLFYLPALILFVVFMIYPLVSGIMISFTDWDGYSRTRSGVGIENYRRLFGDDNFRTALINTFIYGFGSTILQQVFGLGLALALDRKIKGTAFARAVVYLPALVSPVVMGAIYYLLFQYNNGALNDIVTFFGGERQAWLSEGTQAIIIIVAVNSLQFVGISMIIYLAGLQNIPTMYTEAATLDGAGGWKRFRFITLPLLAPAFTTSIALNLIGGLKLFDVVKVMTGGGPGFATHSVSTLIGQTYFDNQLAGYASAMGVVLFVLIAIFTLVINGILQRKQVEQ